jgi:L-2-hydroxyglutarate oxidase
MIHDFCVIGGGIIGLATASRLLECRPGASLVLVEKEKQVAAHQTSHNSGVVHAGVYYSPGSLKAQLCRAGADATKAFAARHDIPVEVCGKLIVATTPLELERMAALQTRGRENGLEIHELSARELGEVDPGVAGVGALLVPSTGIVSYRRISEQMAAEITLCGGEIRLGEAVRAISETGDAVRISTDQGEIVARQLVACAGLQSDRIAIMAGLRINHRIVPFRGEYYVLDERLKGAVKHLIYPVPDPQMPFLGIHLTRMIDGRTTVGPNATLGLAREGYPRYSFDLRDIASMVGFPGLWRNILANRRYAVDELKNSILKHVYLRQCQKYYPDLRLADLQPHPAGIRAQAIMRDGTMVEDFLFIASDRMLHVCNAPSPAATSAIPIAQSIVSQLLKQKV